jgi:hypothetical protein
MKLFLWIDSRQTIKTAYSDLEAHNNFLIHDIQPSEHMLIIPMGAPRHSAGAVFSAL